MTDASRDLRTRYRRDDGEWMVEVRPGQFINEKAAARLQVDVTVASEAKAKSKPTPRPRKTRATD